MKMIMAIVSSDDANRVSSHLTKENYSVTKLSTTGGFLKAGNATLLVGTDDERVDHALEIISQHSKKRTQVMPSSAVGMGTNAGVLNSRPVEVLVGGATVFILNVERFEKM